MCGSTESRVALVTGATRGIGKAIAQELARAGHTVIGTATSDAGAETITSHLSEWGGAGIRLDVSDSEAVKAAIAQIAKAHGAPTILVNNAGITRDNLVMRMKDEEWADVIGTNLNPLFTVSKACLRGMTKSRWGRIINIGSEVFHLGVTPFTAYVSAKGGQNGFNRSLAHELAPWNITVNMIAPGWIPVERHEKDPQELKDGYFASIPMQRWGVPEDLAGTIIYLASEASSFVTGQNIHVNGGTTVH